MPWQLLELDPKVATTKDVKRSYAKRLKSCRPDQDPEGFRKLHDAYTLALAQLEWRDVPGAAGFSDEEEDERFSSSGATSDAPSPSIADEVEAPAVPIAVSHTNELSPGRRAITDAFERLNEALSKDEADIAELMRAAETALYENPEETIAWGNMMNEVIVKHDTHDAVKLRPDAMLFELEHGGLAATMAIIERLDRTGNPQGISSFARLIQENKARLATPGGGFAATRLACASAFWVRRHTEDLANFAYEHLARGERDYYMQMIDHHLQMADLLKDVPDSLWHFWRKQLTSTQGRESWEGEEAAKVLDWMKSPAGRRSSAYEVLRSHVPEELAGGLPEKAVAWGETTSTGTTGSTGSTTVHGNKRGGSNSKPNYSGSGEGFDWESEKPRVRSQARRRVHQPQSSVDRYSGRQRTVPVGAIIWGVIILIKCLVLASRCQGDSSASSRAYPRAANSYPPLYSPPRADEINAKVRKGIEERMKEAREKAEEVPEAFRLSSPAAAD